MREPFHVLWSSSIPGLGRVEHGEMGEEGGKEKISSRGMAIPALLIP